MKAINLLFLTALLLNSHLVVHAQNNEVEKELGNDFISFFTGKWYGTGEFASGKPIEANLSFEMTLDSAWVIYHHIDKKPNSFKATSMWGKDNQTGEFIAYIFDNFKGHRKFSSEGWLKGRLVLFAERTHSSGKTYFEHFVYEKLNQDSFKMTYEVSGDNENWRMVDYLVFKRISESS
ncbi:DUF1579 domain-containing protein [Xanthovirga aplysinae]|uniref:DUF1579 domain-containing protein n=1 Tax=Xanthovirga aplysinae TaxID=2529853 RepID=UPI0012BC5B09|nr:DUF1579 domain-containing protein [Xanthovirga aplysinae]MTI32103.1 DUF1579 domain-containing protein [Xanthovirga aplysinae]